MNELKPEQLYEIKKEYMIGYLAGVINGITYRKDITNELKELCKRVHEEYKRLYDTPSLYVKQEEL